MDPMWLAAASPIVSSLIVGGIAFGHQQAKTREIKSQLTQVQNDLSVAHNRIDRIWEKLVNGKAGDL